MKKDVSGIILITTCYKYEKIRKIFRINHEYINNWKIIYVYGNPDLEEEYKLEKNNLIIKCEDSYIHLIQKISIKYDYIE